MELMKIHGLTVADLAKALDISISQVYTWNRKGISKHNPHFKKLKQLIPEVQPKEELVTKDGKEDLRYKAGRKKKQLKLTETDLPSYQEKKRRSAIFPKIYMTTKPH